MEWNLGRGFVWLRLFQRPWDWIISLSNHPVFTHVLQSHGRSGRLPSYLWCLLLIAYRLSSQTVQRMCSSLLVQSLVHTMLLGNVSYCFVLTKKYSVHGYLDRLTIRSVVTPTEYEVGDHEQNAMPWYRRRQKMAKAQGEKSTVWHNNLPCDVHAFFLTGLSEHCSHLDDCCHFTCRKARGYSLPTSGTTPEKSSSPDPGSCLILCYFTLFPSQLQNNCYDSDNLGVCQLLSCVYLNFLWSDV